MNNVSLIVVGAVALTISLSAGAQKCQTVKEKTDAIEAFILEHHGKRAWSDLEIYPSISESDGPFETYFYPEGESCEGVVTVNTDCEIEGEIRCRRSTEP